MSPSASLYDMFSPQPAAPPPQQQVQAMSAPAPAAADDDWNFASSLPGESEKLPVENDLTVFSNADLEIVFGIKRSPYTPKVIIVTARFSNLAQTLITELTFQVAVTKGMTLTLLPQTGRVLPVSQKDGVTQHIEIHGVEVNQGNAVKMRWKISYKIDGVMKQEQGEVPPLGIY